MKTGIAVSDAMTTKPVTIGTDETVLAAVKLMQKKHVGSLLVVKNDALKGIFTERDLVRVVAKGVNLKELKISEVMITHLHTAKPSDDLAEAIHHMQKNKVRRLPIVYKNKVVGMLTQQDIIRVQPALWEILMGRGAIKVKKEKKKYMEGECDICENFAELHEHNGQYLCAECLEEE